MSIILFRGAITELDKKLQMLNIIYNKEINYYDNDVVVPCFIRILIYNFKVGERDNYFISKIKLREMNYFKLKKAFDYYLEKNMLFFKYSNDKLLILDNINLIFQEYLDNFRFDKPINVKKREKLFLKYIELSDKLFD